MEALASVVRALHQGELAWPMRDGECQHVRATALMLESAWQLSGQELYQRCREAML